MSAYSRTHESRPASDSHPDPFVAFAQPLKVFKSDQVDPFDPENGPAVAWRKVCQKRLDYHSFDLTPEQKDLWSLERNTWQLVHMLYSQRAAGTQSVDSSLLSDPYLPPLGVVNAHLASSQDLLELSTLRDWLHTCPSSTHPAEIRRGYWPYTKASIKHGLQKQPVKSSSTPNQLLVRSLDPDAPLRSVETNFAPADGTLASTQPFDVDGKAQLDQLDQDYERAMVRTLFEYVRVGEIGLALDFCRQCDHPWRAASLSGGRLFHDPTLYSRRSESSPPLDDDQMDALEINGAQSQQAVRSGCINRKLWKSMCIEMASNKSLPTYEQALYGALAGDVASVLPVCNNWEDHIWCHINSIFEKEVDQILDSTAPTNYWSNGCLPFNHDRDSTTNLQDSTENSSPIDQGRPVTSSTDVYSSERPTANVRIAINQAFDTVLRSSNHALAESARNPFHVAQMWLAINKIHDLLKLFSGGLPCVVDELSREHLSHQLRFFSHLTIFLRLIGERVDSTVSNTIIRAYVHVLETENQHDLIAFYVAQLQRDSAVETYARYLISMAKQSDLPTRRVALYRASEQGLDLSRVARTTVELTLQEVKQAPIDYASQDALGRMDHQLTDRHKFLIQSLEWLTFDPVTCLDALTQGNSLIRFFLASGYPNAAREVVRLLPLGLLSLVAKDQDSQQHSGNDSTVTARDEILEFTQYRDFFNCLELHILVNEVMSQRPLDNSQAKLLAFVKPLSGLCDQLYSAVVEILTSEWLQVIRPTTNSEGSGEVRSAEKDRIMIRKMYIPELVFRLHEALVNSGPYIPANLRRALDVATIVADESYKNYAEFLPDASQYANSSSSSKSHKIQDYLRGIRSLVLIVLGQSGTHPFKPAPGLTATV